jgi:hypothetical protein
MGVRSNTSWDRIFLPATSLLLDLQLNVQNHVPITGPQGLRLDRVWSVIRYNLFITEIVHNVQKKTTALSELRTLYANS